jgi:aspartate/methionine/tyrosine aminotransferase
VETFYSILAIDTLAEAGLDPSYVHVVTSASKDFGINGFRLGVLVSQHNPALQRALMAVGLLSQTSSPAGALWYTLLEDRAYLAWYLCENRRRLRLAYAYTTEWAAHHGLPFIGSASGFFFMIDLRRPLGIVPSDSLDAARAKENVFFMRLIDDARVYLAPGAMYHYPLPGWFRLTFTQDSPTLHLGLARLEPVLGLAPFAAPRSALDFSDGPAPPSPARAKPGCLSP